MHGRESPLPSRMMSVAGGRRALAALMVACAVVAVGAGDASGQFGAGNPAFRGGGAGGGFGFNPVGGISVDTDGIIRTVDATLLDESVRAMRAAVAEATLPARPGATRTVSLAGVIAAVQEAAEGRRPIPIDVALLGGLERITHVCAMPEEHDILLVGPAASSARSIPRRAGWHACRSSSPRRRRWAGIRRRFSAAWRRPSGRRR